LLGAAYGRERVDPTGEIVGLARRIYREVEYAAEEDREATLIGALIELRDRSRAEGADQAAASARAAGNHLRYAVAELRAAERRASRIIDGADLLLGE